MGYFGQGRQIRGIVVGRPQEQDAADILDKGKTSPFLLACPALLARPPG
ncbi:hypothetical protein [Streptomyces sp. NBC_01320]|nr:hypothetical protein OG395_56665 [Streptomyces sp. NBC_01320]